ncbi:hypothetical protein M0D69_42905 [Caballeronia sp. SEWSISQ10-4 2]|nr:hypothetical protein [Caballeronia sp. SEWSISQ10-4 2]
MAAVLATRGDYQLAFAVMAVPALINLCFLTVARLVFPRPQDMEQRTPSTGEAGGFPTLYWVYLAGAGLVAAGFADYPLIAYHWVKHHTLTTEWIPIFYAVAMAVSGGASLVLGRLFDRYGFKVLIGLTGVSLFFAPLVFLGGNFGLAILGAALWGMGMGMHGIRAPDCTLGKITTSALQKPLGGLSYRNYNLSKQGRYFRD